MIGSLLVANRGEIARRVLRTARHLGIRTVAVYSDADADALHVAEANHAVRLGPAPPAQSYLDSDAVLRAAGLVWVGPDPESIELMGDKVSARNLMSAAGVPVAPGSTEPLSDVGSAVLVASAIGYPVMVKASAGGGGIGMSVAADEATLRAAFETARSRAERFFGDPAVLLERYIAGARHVEVQVLGLADGRVVPLPERDCSVQRRHQKVAEETPSPGVDDALRARMLAAAVRAGEAVGYRGAGTVECLVDPVAGDFVFLEMNTRLQVEHPVTEMVTGVDLVLQQLRFAAGEAVTFDPDTLTASGHAIELRVYAEDPVRFLPGPGLITTWHEPHGPG
ncbi:MAG: biotin carboxylase N-terminal domain-containing protein, partial [Actinomycetes bacterium]